MKHTYTLAAASLAFLAASATVPPSYKMKTVTRQGINHYEANENTKGTIADGRVSINGTDLGRAVEISSISVADDADYIFVKPTSSGSADGSTWENAMGVAQFAARLGSGDASLLNGKIFCLSGGDYNLYGLAPRSEYETASYLPLNFPGAASAVNITISGGFDPASTGKSVARFAPAKYPTVFSGDNPSAGTQGKPDAADAAGFYIGANAFVDISDVTFTCFYGKRGAAFYLHGANSARADLNIYNSTFKNIAASDGGGAINLTNKGGDEDAAFRCVGCTFEDIAGEWGSVMKITSGKHRNALVDCTVRNCKSSAGLIRMENSGKLDATGCVFDGNTMTATSSSEYGSVVTMVWGSGSGCSLRADGCRFTNNHTTTRGVLCASTADDCIWLSDCYFSGNSGDDEYDGVIRAGSGAMVCLNNTTIYNPAPSAKAGSIQGDFEGIIMNSTFVGDPRSAHILCGSKSYVKVLNSIVMSPTDKAAFSRGSASMRSAGYNICSSADRLFFFEGSDRYNQLWDDSVFALDGEAGVFRWSGDWLEHTHATRAQLDEALRSTLIFDPSRFVRWLTEDLGDRLSYDALGNPRDPQALWPGAFQGNHSGKTLAPNQGQSEIIDMLRSCNDVLQINDNWTEKTLSEGVTYTHAYITKRNGDPDDIYIVKVAPGAPGVAVTTEAWEPEKINGWGWVPDNTPSAFFDKFNVEGHRILALVNGDFFTYEGGKGPMHYRGRVLWDIFNYKKSLPAQGIGWVGIDKNGIMHCGPRATYKDYKDELVECTGAGYNMLHDGVIGPNAVTDANGNVLEQCPWSYPSNVIGHRADNTMIFLICDGRTSRSRGMEYEDMGKIMKALGCTDAVMMDGGGSAQMLINDLTTGEHGIVNVPNDGEHPGMERKLCNYWSIVLTNK